MRINMAGELPAAYGKKRVKVSLASDVADLIPKGLDREAFFCAHINIKQYVIAVDLVSLGCLSAAIVHPREVFKSAILNSASSIICIHNHPSGDIAPSAEDRDLTTRLAKAGAILGIKLQDHVIVGDGYFSFLEAGYI